MKKILFFTSLIILGLVIIVNPLFAQINTSAVNASNEKRKNALELIPAPWLVNKFEGIRQIGNALWGFKRSEINQEQTNQILDRISTETASTTDRIEAHIKSISDMRFFTNIRRREDGKLFGIPKDPNFKVQPIEEIETIPSLSLSLSNEEKNCVIAAIQNKDEALKENNRQFLTDLNNIINDRMTCQLDVIGDLESGSHNKIKECNQSFIQMQKEIKVRARDAQKLFWKNYKEDLRACRYTDAAYDSIYIEDGGNFDF